MRGLAHRRLRDEEEESAFVSMTDMTISFLFIVMILLAFFASQYDPAKSVPLPEYQKVIAERDAARTERAELAEILEKLRKALANVRLEAEVAKVQLRSSLDREATLSSDLSARDVLIKALELQNEQSTQKIAQLMALLAQEAQREAEMNKQISDLKGEIDRIKALLAQAAQREVDMNKQISDLKAEIERLKVPNPLETYISQSLAERRLILLRLRDQIRQAFPDIGVEISEQSDALRFQGDGLFRSGSATLRPDRVDLVREVARRLQEILPCYTLGQAADWKQDCNPGFAVIEALQIEGHTDGDGGDINNLILSTARANATFITMQGEQPGLIEHLNFASQPVLSVAGYGEMRPISANDTPEHKATNRRIDLRIIMYVPKKSEEIDKIRAALEVNTALTGAN